MRKPSGDKLWVWLPSFFPCRDLFAALLKQAPSHRYEAFLGSQCVPGPPPVWGPSLGIEKPHLVCPTSFYLWTYLKFQSGLLLPGKVNAGKMNKCSAIFWGEEGPGDGLRPGGLESFLKVESRRFSVVRLLKILNRSTAEGVLHSDRIRTILKYFYIIFSRDIVSSLRD